MRAEQKNCPNVDVGKSFLEPPGSSGKKNNDLLPSLWGFLGPCFRRLAVLAGSNFCTPSDTSPIAFVVSKNNPELNFFT
jgi:hypothetical protein